MVLEKTTEKTRKKTRFSKFEMVIDFEAKDQRNLLNLDENTLTNKMISSNFVGQLELEDAIATGRIKSRYNSTPFIDYEGQLQRNQQTGKPYWMVYLQTKIQVISLDIVKYFEGVFRQNKTHCSIKVRPISKKLIFDFKKLLFLPRSKWNPGHFSKKTTNIRRLLEDDDTRKIVIEILKNKDYRLRQ